VKQLLREALGYLAASGCALVVDMTILFLLVHFFSWGYLSAATISFLAGAWVAYELSVRIAFKQHRLQDRRTELASFVVIGAIGLLINAAVIYIGVRFLGLHYLLAKCLAAGFTFTCNFIARRQLLFVPQTSVRES
jgi:putative flippase GtrA